MKDPGLDVMSAGETVCKLAGTKVDDLVDMMVALKVLTMVLHSVEMRDR